jgi:glycerophosphoryl diester phosphodiesterase
MKNITLLLCFLTVGLTGCTVFEKSSLNPEKWHKQLGISNDDIVIVSHRTCWRLAPENSIHGIRACIDNEIDMGEIDIQRTKDGYLVLMHDLSVDRMSNGKGLVKDFTFAEIRQLRLKEFDGGDMARVTEQVIPTLKEALTAAKGKILLNLDAKADIREQAYAEAKEMGMTEQILIKNYITEPTDELRGFNFYGNTLFMPIIKEIDGDLGVIVKNFDAEPQIAYEVIYTTEAGLKSACQAAKKQGAGCWVNTLWESLSPGHSDDRNMENPDAHWGYLVRNFGVNMIQTDRPLLLREYLLSKNLHK